MTKTFKRAAYYYHVFTPDGADNFAKKLRKVCSLPEREREYEYQDATVNISIRSEDFVIDGKHIVTGVVRILRYVAPSIGERGTNDSHPIHLEENQGVNEKTHFAYSPDSNTLTVEYNHYGPKIGLLLKIVNELYRQNFDEASKDNSYIYVSAKSAWRKLADSGGVRTVMFEYADVTSQALATDSPYSVAVRDLLSKGTPQTAQITLKPEKGSRGSIMSVREFVDKFKAGLNSGQLSKLKAKVITENETGSTDEIDFIKDKLAKDFSVVIMSEGTKEINSTFLLEAMATDLAERSEKNGE